MPSPPPWAVSRTPLVNRLRATSTSVVMLVAPAGYGKTTLAAQWAERERRPCAWLTVDESDDDAAVLLARVAKALERIRPDDAPPVAPARRPKDWSTELQRLASRLSTLRGLRARGRRGAPASFAQRDEGARDAGRARPGGIDADAGGTPRPVAADRASSRGREVARAACCRPGAEPPGERGAAALPGRGSHATTMPPSWSSAARAGRRVSRLSALAAREHAGGLDHALPGGDDRFLAEYFQLRVSVPADGRAADVPPANIGARAPDRPGLRRRAEAEGLGPHPRVARAPAPARRPARPARRGVPLPSAAA